MKNTITLLIFLAAFSMSQAATYSWTNWSGSGNWNDPMNWDLGNVPGAGDQVEFNGKSNGACHIQHMTMVDKLTIKAGYKGTIEQGSNGMMLIGSGGLDQQGGYFLAIHSQMSVAGDFQLSGGVFETLKGSIVVDGLFLVSTGTYIEHQDLLQAHGTILPDTLQWLDPSYHQLRPERYTNSNLDHGVIHDQQGLLAPGSNLIPAVETAAKLMEETMDGSLKMTLYPNPVVDFASLRLNGTDERVQLNLIDLSGKIIRSLEVIDPEDNTIELDLSELAQGIYLMNAKQGDEEITQQIQKIH